MVRDKASDYDPYHAQRLEERRQAKRARSGVPGLGVVVAAVANDLSDLKEKLRSQAGKGASRGKAEREPVTSIAKVQSDRDRKNSRVKGCRGELDVAAAFSRWSGEVVRRTPGSGGWSSAKFGVTADLVCPNKAFPFHVEVKHREGWTLDDLVTGFRADHDKSIVQWWKQCVESCPKRDRFRESDKIEFTKEPLLVFRRNRQPWLVMMRWDATEIQDAGAMFTLPFAPAPYVTVMLLEVFLDLEPVPKGLKNFERST